MDTTCHPDRPVFARGLCQSCYLKLRKQERPTEEARRAAGLKLCRRCGDEKPFAQFSPKHSICKPCRVVMVREYEQPRKKDPAFIEARRRATREWARRNRPYMRNSALVRKYGITTEDYDRLVRQQRGRCAVCRRKPERFLAVDHDHKTGRIRGLLCDPCNHGVGNFLDDPKLLERAIAYLSK